MKHACRPRQVGDITEASLLRYSGRDPSLPLCFAIRGKVLDVTEGRDFYGPGRCRPIIGSDPLTETAAVRVGASSTMGSE